MFSNVPHTRPDSFVRFQQAPRPPRLSRSPQTLVLHVPLQSFPRPLPLRDEKEAVKARRGPSLFPFRSPLISPQAIRKKIESELARKRTISTTFQSGRSKRPAKPAVAKGTVAALKPSPALTVPENITVAEASQLCAAKRTDCVLVVDDDEGLSGIFTAKDLAYRVCPPSLRTLQSRQ